MAPRKKKVETADLSAYLLTSDQISLFNDILAATIDKGFSYCVIDSDISALVNTGLIEVNYEIINPRNKKQIAIRATNKGIKTTMAKKQVNVTETDTIGNFAVGTFDLSAVKAKAKSARRGRESKYHLDRLNVGEFIFVPCTPAHDSSDKIAKSLNGTIQAANKKYAEPTGEYKTIARKAKGSDERVEKQVAVTRAIRKFEVYGYNHGGVDGAAMVRVM